MHRKVGKSRVDCQEAKVQEATGLLLSDTSTILEDLINNYVESLSQSECLQTTRKRALLLPHCSRKYVDNGCKA